MAPSSISVCDCVCGGSREGGGGDESDWLRENKTICYSYEYEYSFRSADVPPLSYYVTVSYGQVASSSC